MLPTIAITGAAGLVGQNLIPRLKAHQYTDFSDVAVGHGVRSGLGQGQLWSEPNGTAVARQKVHDWSSS